MSAHIKLETGGRPAPRIHFFDDTAGATGLVVAGQPMQTANLSPVTFLTELGRAVGKDLAEYSAGFTMASSHLNAGTA